LKFGLFASGHPTKKFRTNKTSFIEVYMENFAFVGDLVSWACT